MMATAVQKTGMKPLSNGSGYDVKEIANLSSYSIVDQCNDGYTNIVQTNYSTDENLMQKVQPASDNVENPVVQEVANAESEPEIDIVINNVVSSFSVRCHLNLRDIALNGMNVEYRREHGMITMKLRRPYTTASIWSSGKVTCTGATSEDQARIASRRFARLLQKLGFNVRFNNYRVVNVLGTCSMPFGIKVHSFSERHKEAEYEPELHPGVTYKLKSPKATLKIFSTGSVTVTAPSVANIQAAIEYIFPLIYEFRNERTSEDDLRSHAAKKKRMSTYNGAIENSVAVPCKFDDEEEEEVEAESESEW